MYFDPRLFAMTRGQRGRIALAAAVGLAGLPIGIARLALSGVIVAALVRGQPLAEVAPLLLLVAVLTAARALVQLLKEEIANRVSAAMKVHLRRLLYRHVLRLGPGPFDQQRTGGVLLTLVDGVEQLESFFGLYLPQLIVAGLTPLILFGFMATLDLPTAFIYLIFSAVSLVLPAIFHRWNASASLTRRNAYSDLGADFVDGVQGLATLKAFGQSQAHGRRLAERAQALYQGTMAVLAASTATGSLTLLGISAGAALALGWGAVRVERGELALQTLFIVLLLGVEIFRPLRELTALYHKGMLAMAATGGLYAILDSVPAVRDPADDGRTTEGDGFRATVASPSAADGPNLAPEVRFDGVRFAYPGRPNALDGVSFDLRAGERLGLVGPSGAGKSTVVWLLLRFFDPQQGRIVLGGRDLRDLPLDVVRRQFAVVTQDTFLFHGTVAENLRFGKPEATSEELVRAARLANAHDFIMALPHGYETVVGERGARLSGGQRQRIAIARALLKDAPILLLDEALSSVDSENESIIQQALERLQRGRTTLVIAHRLSSVVDCDRILVLDRGQLVESGTHPELVASGGVYARLMSEQAVEAASQEAATARLEDAGAVLTSTTLVPDAAESAEGDGHGAPPPVELPAPLSGATVWRRLLLLVRPWWGKLSGTFVLGLARSASIVALALVSSLVVARAARGEELTGLLWSLGFLVFGSAVLTWLENWLAHDLAYGLLADMRIAMYAMLDPLAPAYFQRRRSGDLASTVTGDIELIEYFFAHTITPVVVAVLVPGAVLLGLALLAWPLALALAPFLLLVAYSPFVAQRAAERIGERTRHVLGDVNAFMVDSIQGLRTIVAFQQGPARLEQVADYTHRYNDFQLAFLRNQAVHNAVIEAAIGFGTLAVLATGAWLVSTGGLAPILLPLAVVTALASFTPVTELAKTVKELAGTLAAARRIFAIHDEPVPVRDGPGVPDEEPSDVPGQRTARPSDGRMAMSPRLVFDDVRFRYGPGLPPALRGLSFEVEPGQTVALVGRSGAGKTTAAHLVLRFWDPESGRISLGGRDIREFKLDDLRQRIALVAQDTYLFNASLRDNLALGRPEASLSEIERAARLASLHDFVQSLPEGYDTPIGERGFHLSGGQRQRLAIARAILKDAPVLILDEATSHLDAENERRVHAALEELMRGRTTLVIAHRLSTVRRADAIVVLDAGVVVEQGTHDELLASGGLYARLVSSQLAAQAGARNGSAGVRSPADLLADSALGGAG